MSERTFSEEEIGILLQRAAQLQGASRPAAASGLTIRELQEAAAEAGIDARFVQAAVREAEQGLHLGGQSGQTNTKVFVERTVSGRSAPAVFETAVLQLRDRFSSDGMDQYGLGPQYGPGVFEQLGETHTWRHTTAMGVATVATVRPADGGQHLRIERRVGSASTRAESIGLGIVAAVIMGGIVTGVCSAAGLIGAPALGALVFLLSAVASGMVAVPLIARLDTAWRAKKLAEITELADRIAAEAAEAVAAEAAIPAEEAAPAQSEGAEERRVELPTGAAAYYGYDPDDPETRRAASTRRRE